MRIILSLELTKNLISCSFTMNVFLLLLPPPQWTKSISSAEQQFLKEPHAQMHGRFLQMPPNNGSILGNFPLILNLIRHRTVAHPVLSCLVSQTLCYLSSLPSLGPALAVSVIWVYIPVKRWSDFRRQIEAEFSPTCWNCQQKNKHDEHHSRSHLHNNVFGQNAKFQTKIDSRKWNNKDSGV